jgi:hypothetical protein
MKITASTTTTNVIPNVIREQPLGVVDVDRQRPRSRSREAVCFEVV